MTRVRFYEFLVSLVLLVAGFFTIVSFATYQPTDVSFNVSGPMGMGEIRNVCGLVGAYLAFLLVFFFGRAGWALPALLLFWSATGFSGHVQLRARVKAIGALAMLISLATLMSLDLTGESRFYAGGLTGVYLAQWLLRYLGLVGSYFMALPFFVLALFLATEFLLIPFLARMALGALAMMQLIKVETTPAEDPGSGFGVRGSEMDEGQAPGRKLIIKKIKQRLEKAAVLPRGRGKRDEGPSIVHHPSSIVKGAETTAPAPTVFNIADKPRKLKPASEEDKPRKVVSGTGREFTLPPLTLLQDPPLVTGDRIQEDLEDNARILKETLQDFGIEVEVTEVNRGPVVTRFEVLPAPGVKVSSITTLADNLSLALKAQSVRIVAPIPGKNAVGIEVPNATSTTVCLKELLQSDEYRKGQSSLPLVIGKDISGAPLIADLAEMPHLLIAGTTGSGKTVCVNSFLGGLLFSLSPDQLRLVIIDPKMVEMAAYNGLPHLLCPVVTDVKRAAGVLNWIVNEMEERYKLFARVGARNIKMYNEMPEKISHVEGSTSTTPGGDVPDRIPYIVVVVDELADLMMVAQDKVEHAITRLAQLSRAVGIHLLLATQRPSVDVITGVIKANFPARIAFQVASRVDSRTVLDSGGADKLLGKGDLLFLKPGASKPARAQGTWVRDEEINRLAEFLRQQRSPEYSEDILKEGKKLFNTTEAERDEVYKQSVEVVMTTRNASASMLQRRLRLGYTRAARMIDMMEEDGLVGPYRGSKAREILVETPRDHRLTAESPTVSSAVARANENDEAQDPESSESEKDSST